MVPAHVKRHLPLLEYLSKSTPKIRRAIIQESNPEIIKVLSECANSVIKGGIPLNNAQSSKLKRYRKQLHLLSKKSVSLKKKRKVLSGGFLLGSLLGTLLPALVGALGSIVKPR